uniref:Uncharacterized protein n=1 Tax=Lotus japonicus TaxID=34305 RepID=I3SHW1_LOTJA|nr:unknown [Lotus japonicus]
MIFRFLFSQISKCNCRGCKQQSSPSSYSSCNSSSITVT